MSGSSDERFNIFMGVLKNNLADQLTKPLGRIQFEKKRKTKCGLNVVQQQKIC